MTEHPEYGSCRGCGRLFACVCPCTCKECQTGAELAALRQAIEAVKGLPAKWEKWSQGYDPVAAGCFAECAGDLRAALSSVAASGPTS